MGRFLDRYNKHPERGTELYLDQARGYCASLSLGRDFNESIDDFIARSPSAAIGMKEAHDDIQALKSVRCMKSFKVI